MSEPIFNTKITFAVYVHEGRLQYYGISQQTVEKAMCNALDSLRDKYVAIYSVMVLYGNVQIPKISRNFEACTDSVYTRPSFHVRKGAWGRGYCTCSYYRRC